MHLSKLALTLLLLGLSGILVGWTFKLNHLMGAEQVFNAGTLALPRPAAPSMLGSFAPSWFIGLMLFFASIFPIVTVMGYAIIVEILAKQRKTDS